jgi:hypothetical protein
LGHHSSNLLVSQLKGLDEMIEAVSGSEGNETVVEIQEQEAEERRDS